MRGTRPIRTSVAIPALACAICFGCDSHERTPANDPESTPVPVRLQSVDARPSPVYEEIVGTLRAKRRTTIEARIAGRIVEIRAVPGESVKAGNVLVRLDLPEIRARLDQATAVREQAERDLERYTALFDGSAATPAELEAVQARARVAAAAVREARALLDDARVTAPFDGVVARKLAEVGDLAAPGKPLVEIEDPATLRVDAWVGEALIDQVVLGRPIEVRTLRQSEPILGTVAEIAPAADPANRTFVVTLDIPPTPGLRAGMFVRVAVPLGETAGLRVPAEAVVRRGQLELVFVAVDGRAALRLVKTGKRRGDAIEILSGLTAGEQVIVADGARLREGQPLQIHP